MRRGLSAQGGFCGVQSTAQNRPVYSVLSPRGDKSRRKITTFLHKMKSPVQYRAVTFILLYQAQTVPQ